MVGNLKILIIKFVNKWTSLEHILHQKRVAHKYLNNINFIITLNKI